MSLIPLVQGGHSAASIFDATLIGNSVWLDGSADHLTKSFGSGADQQEFVLAAWVQRNSFGSLQFFFGSGASARQFGFGFTASDELELRDFDSPINARYISNALFRDVGWYHILASIKTTESTASDRVKIFVNGSEITSFSTETDPSLNFDMNWGISGDTHNIGSYFDGSAKNFFKGYVAQPLYISGKSIQGGDFTISNFLGTLNGARIPKTDSAIAALASAGGASSFCLDFSNSADLGNDLSSKNNDFSPTSMASTNQSNHSPSLVYPTMNPLNDVSTVVLSEGNTRVNAQSSASIRSTAFAAAGKRYAELTVTAVGNSYLGVAVNGTNPTSFAATGAVACQQDGDIYVSSSSPSGNKCPAYTTGDVLGILIDVDADKFWVSKNGTFHSMDRSPTITLTASQVLAGTGGFDLTALGSGGSYAIHVGNSDGTAANVLVNFGQYTFSHTPPTGYKNWASNNFDTLTFSNPATGSFTGNASTDGSFVFLGFQPSPSDALTINSNSVTYGTDVDLCNNGFKVRSSSSNFNSTGTNTYSLVTTNALQINGEFPPSYGITN